MADGIRLSEQYDIVNSFRRRAPVDVQGLSVALGVPVYYSYLPDDISGMIEPQSDGRFRILVNQKHPSTRQRFTIAHELGHYMLHRHLIGAGIGDDRAYRSADTGKYQNALIGPRHESEANRFAANVLMPPELIREAENEGINDPNAIARRLGVSSQAMHIRMGIPYEPHPGFF